VPVGVKPRAIPRLDKLDTAGLVAALDSPNGWQRDTAQMVLLWRNDKEAVPLLEKVGRESKNPLARLHALCTLDGIRRLELAIVQLGLSDSHAGVRRHAIRLCEGHAKNDSMFEELLKFQTDRDQQLIMQLAYTLGQLNQPIASGLLGELLRKCDDHYL